MGRTKRAGGRGRRKRERRTLRGRGWQGESEHRALGCSLARKTRNRNQTADHHPLFSTLFSLSAAQSVPKSALLPFWGLFHPDRASGLGHAHAAHDVVSYVRPSRAGWPASTPTWAPAASCTALSTVTMLGAWCGIACAVRSPLLDSLGNHQSCQSADRVGIALDPPTASHSPPSKMISMLEHWHVLAGMATSMLGSAEEMPVGATGGSIRCGGTPLTPQ